MPEGPFGGPRPWVEGATRVDVDERFIGEAFEGERPGSFKVFIEFNKRVRNIGLGRSLDPVTRIVEQEAEDKLNTDIDVSTVPFRSRMLDFILFPHNITDDPERLELQLILMARRVNERLRERHEKKVLSNVRPTLQIEEIFTAETTNVKGER